MISCMLDRNLIQLVITRWHEVLYSRWNSVWIAAYDEFNNFDCIEYKCNTWKDSKIIILSTSPNRSSLNLMAVSKIPLEDWRVFMTTKMTNVRMPFRYAEQNRQKFPNESCALFDILQIPLPAVIKRNLRVEFLKFAKPCVPDCLKICRGEFGPIKACFMSTDIHHKGLSIRMTAKIELYVPFGSRDNICDRSPYDKQDSTVQPKSVQPTFC